MPRAVALAKLEQVSMFIYVAGWSGAGRGEGEERACVSSSQLQVELLYSAYIIL